MANKSDKVKLIVAIVGLVAAAAIFAVQYWPASGGGAKSQADALKPVEEISTDKSGAKVIRQGSHAQREAPPGK